MITIIDFQLSETTWYLIGLHGNNSKIIDVTGGRHLGFLNFQILLKFWFGLGLVSGLVLVVFPRSRLCFLHDNDAKTSTMSDTNALRITAKFGFF